ncbi:MAG TPA: hypothetical protein PLC09_04920 [Holophaga sp.]|nr:hypothetical protein [Holophaga sp.]
MDRRQLTLYVALPLVAVVGIIGWHRVQRNRELSRQARQKTEGLVTVSTAEA